ncbi:MULTISPECIES: efflux transporter outer membrane subunit [Alphaproteobacteria]|jgi:outer membrane protein, multidrug efflux system|uniref:TolC family protein n=1 Tax=Parasphingorhabdus flavimaris TaxID=266812 RepID=A0ABX2N0V3_9SPHN|nr:MULTISPECIES: TolC family protein [Alphaproteobacteria]ATW02129.1 RND transporter [Sphingorhabdus sp. YGSMI21]MBQ0767616.1 TolC family protein [Sulfitobacter litoralis]NVD27261.1 TolC family protein [Parasphingorhabdus flavimaris]PHR20721.1 MAG: RND transporter [Sphingopyxis sp.]|tara:strand:- start:2165 stop:3622 length:1458 start_codon:yes stop_codon:yes gene_type:complete
MIRKSIPFLLIAATLAGCTAGPDYAGPPELAAAGGAGGFIRAGDKVSSTVPELAEWWILLDDPGLDRLIEAALADNPSLEAVGARIAQSRASLAQENAGRLPSLGTQATVVQGRLPGLDIQGGPPLPPGTPGMPPEEEDDTISFYNAGLNANWEIDFGGGTGRRIEAANAQLAAAVANAEDARVQLTADVANAYVNLREAQQRVVRYRLQSELQEQILVLTYQRYQQGTLPLFPVGNANAELELLKSQLAEAEADEAVLLDALAVLTGRAPGAPSLEVAPIGEIPLPPERVAVGDPASLIARRPDIRAAERTLAAATARVGVAEAAKFPKLSFMGILGLGGTSPEDIFDVGEFSAIAIPRLQWNFLDFGRVDASIDRAGAARREAAANYRQTVLAALQDAERALARFAQQRAALAALIQVKRHADKSADLNRQRFESGAISRIDLNRTLREQEKANTDLARGRAALTLAWIAVQKSLGLGWQAPS